MSATRTSAGSRCVACDSAGMARICEEGTEQVSTIAANLLRRTAELATIVTARSLSILPGPSFRTAIKLTWGSRLQLDTHFGYRAAAKQRSVNLLANLARTQLIENALRFANRCTAQFEQYISQQHPALLRRSAWLHVNHEQTLTAG